MKNDNIEFKIADDTFQEELSDEIEKIENEDKELQEKINNVKKSLENKDAS